MLPAVLVCSAAAAAEPANSVLVRTKSVGLPAGTVITVDTTASFVVSELHNDGQRVIALDTIEVPADGHLQWRLTADANGTVPENRFRFTFGQPLPDVPPGSIGHLRFKTRYTIQCPNGAKHCISYRNESVFSMTILSKPSAVIERCLNLGVRGTEGVSIGIGACGLK